MGQSICNICGANYVYKNGRWLCPACGAYKQEELSNEEATLLYIADQKRRMADFDEAEKSYTDIIEKYSNNPYAYWGRLLCRHGIKYECDFDGQMIPTCCMPSKENVFTDKDYIRAIDYSDEETKRYFTHQAERIERIRKEWIDKASKEKPYDIFLCYKDSDIINGIERTSDSIVMQDLYIHLEKQGYRVFYSRESLRDKTGEKYEPYIFNALSTAKVMLVYGSKAEYITSTWLKNEWTRFQKLIKDGKKEKNALIVSYEGFTPNELPLSLSSMQCLDASRKTFFHDIDSEIKEVIGVPNNEQREIKSTRTKKVPNCALIEQERLAFNTFLSQLKEIESHRTTTKKPSILSKMFSGVSDEIDENKANLIKTYKIPDTLEVLSEFMDYAASSIDFDTYNLLSQKGNNNVNSSKKAVARSWFEKIEEAYEKAKLRFSSEEGFYQIEVSYKRTKKRIGRERIKFPALITALLLIPIIMCVLIFTLLPLGDDSNNDDGTESSTIIMSEIDWPQSSIAQIVPQPESNYGKIEWETYYGFVIYIGNTTQAEYKDYVDLCWDSGFNIDYNRGADYFWADNADGHKLEIRYQEGDIMFIRIDAKGYGFNK